MKKFYLLLSAIVLAGFTYAQDKTASVSFDGDDDKIVIPHDSKMELGRSAFTIEALIVGSSDMTTNSVDAPVIIGMKEPGASNQGFFIGLNGASGKVAIQIHSDAVTPSGGGSWGSGVPAADLRDDQCHHIAWVREVGGVKDTVMAYQDGDYVKRSRRSIDIADIKSTADMWIGALEFDQTADLYQWTGRIKEVRVWNVQRTEAEINANKDKHLTGNEPGLLFYWRMNENTGSTAYECGSSALDGTLTGGASWANFGCDDLDAIPNGCRTAGSGPTGIAEATDEDKIKIYPNPVNDELRIDVGADIDVQRVVIYDLNGRQLINTNWNATTPLDVSELNSGIYILELNDRESVIHRTRINVK